MSFNSFGNYRLHLKCCEKKYQRNVPQQNDPIDGNPDIGFHVNDECEENDADERPFSPNEENIEDSGINNFCITLEVAKLMLKLKAEKNVTHSALNLIAKGLSDIIRREYLSRNETPPASCDSLQKLDSQKKRLKYFEKHFGFLEPAEIFLAHRKVWKRRKNGRFACKLVPRSFQYISLARRLASLYRNAKFKKMIESEKQSVDGYMYSSRDASGFKNHKQFKIHPSAVRIQLWGDEVEYGNPLGSKKNNNGYVTSLAFTLLNLPPPQNSLLSNIYTLAVIKSSDVKTFGFNPVFKKLMEEVKMLESEYGLNIRVDGRPQILRGTLASVCGDTKGVHEMFGFMSPSSDKFCRLCLISRQDILDHPSAETVKMRDRMQHHEAVIQAKGYGKQIDSGVDSHCILNESEYFHVTENFIMDAMHDFFEGIVPCLLMLCMRHWVNQEDNEISASELNNRIQRFDFGPYDDRNKPSATFLDSLVRKIGNYSTKQRANQNWCLIRNLPLLIGDLVSEHDGYFSVLLDLLDIMDIVFSPKISVEDTVNLSLLIIGLFGKFKENFPGVNPINKFHHLIHYPEIIRCNGPPMGYWCMRYEGHHNLFKRISQINCNFKNTPKSVANHLMLASCSSLMDENAFVENPVSFGPFRLTRDGELNLEDVEEIPLIETEVLKIANWIKIGGWTFFEHSILVLQNSQNSETGLPKFGKILKLIIRENHQPFALTETMETVEYVNHFHCFEVIEFIPGQKSLVPLTLVTEAPLWILKSFEDDSIQYVNPSYVI